ncbi:MAG: DUF4214 domain-containing protein [Acidimicrobiales bacterium]
MLNKMKTAVAVLLAVGTLLVAVPASAQSTNDGAASTIDEATPQGLASLAPNDRITRLYRAALGREPDAAGHDYWVDQIESGESLLALTRSLIDSEEAQNRSTGDPLRDAYLWALGREPDTSGYEYWSQYDAARAVLYISDSAEHRIATGLEVVQAPVVPVVSPSAPAGWVDAGHGVYVPPILLEIRRCESGGNYLAANRRSSARGAYQFLASSWAAYGHAARYGVFEAHLATPAQQDEAAVITWKRDGVRPWYASRSCWG